MHKLTILIAISGISLLLGSAVNAHHSVPVNFDMNTELAITGVLVETSWRNPHSHLVLEVTNEAGEKETWLVEWNAINTIRRLLSKLEFSIDDFEIGEEITVTGWLGRNDKSVYFREVTFSDGRHFVWKTRLNPTEQATK
jgi:hypothetical protein